MSDKPGFFGRVRSWRSRLTDEQKQDERADLSGLEHLSDEDRLLFAEARLGIEVMDFWNSDAGRYLRGRCGEIMLQTARDLLKVSPSDTAKIMELQVNGRAARQMVNFVGDAIAGGMTAEKEIESREADEGVYPDE